MAEITGYKAGRSVTLARCRSPLLSALADRSRATKPPCGVDRLLGTRYPDSGSVRVWALVVHPDHTPDGRALGFFTSARAHLLADRHEARGLRVVSQGKLSVILNSVARGSSRVQYCTSGH